MKLIRGGVLFSGLLLVAGAAQADVSSTVAIVSDYDWRGITQSDNSPALQLSLDYGHESGWYIGAWGSNIDFGTPKPQTEVDVYTGFAQSVGDLGYDVGVNYYGYPGASGDFVELYGKLSYKILSGGLYYSPDFAGSSKDEYYVYADLGIPAGPLTLGLHAGYSSGDGIKEVYFAGTEDSYTDYGFGVSYAASNFTTGIKWIATDANKAGSDDRVVLSVSTKLPWK